MSASAIPVLYSFRRCPYAMRARFAIRSAQIEVELREVKLQQKPDALILVSPKGTVPVLVHDDRVIEESLDIMLWALKRHDPCGLITQHQNESLILINDFDREFKPLLDRYKYFTHHTELTQQQHFEQAISWLIRLESRLQCQPYLCDDQLRLADAAIAPFVRQFSLVDHHRWCSAPLPHLRDWLNQHLATQRWQSIMNKYTPWRPNDKPIFF